MASDQECPPLVEKKFSPEDVKKVGKNSPPKTGKLKKRSEFLNVRKSGESIKGKFFILNFSPSNLNFSKTGITVSRKFGNSVKRNYIKRVIRSILRLNVSNIPKKFNFEIIPKKSVNKINYKELEKDLILLIKKVNV